MSSVTVSLSRAAAAWRVAPDSPHFRATLIEELQALGPIHSALQPLLQRGLAQSSAVAAEPVSVHLLSYRQQDSRLFVRFGVFYAGIIAGCSCADDPAPIESLTEHCELLAILGISDGETALAPADSNASPAAH